MAEEEAKPKFKITLTPALMVAGVNALVALAAAGLLFYTKVAYQRPKITEQAERERLESMKGRISEDATPGTLLFEPPMTVNIESMPGEPKPADGTAAQIEGKLHYVSLAFSLDFRDGKQKEFMETLRPFILDRLISIVGRKNYRELSTVQGRYLLKTQLLDAINELVITRSSGNLPPGFVSAMSFTQFIVQ